MHTKTELHTHLMGMLSYEGLIKLLIKYDYCFPLDYSSKLVFDYNVRRIPVKDIYKSKQIAEQLFVLSGNKISYDNLDELYYARNLLIADLCEYLKQKDENSENSELKYQVYGAYIEESLKELIIQGVEYVEISFSNAKIIENAVQYVDPKLFEMIKCKFLLSTDRSKISKDFRQSSRYMEDLIQKNLAVGFDVMGTEFPLSELDMDRFSKFGMEQKLLPVIEKLNKWDNTTLRVHSGETKYSNENTLKILNIIDRIATYLKINIPPPQIRIGHGIYFVKSDEYIKLLKKFNCIVEINASSNYALNNIGSFSDIPYDYYLDNDIPIVICSDGHGVYDTSKSKEDGIALDNVKNENFKKIIEIDKKIIKEK